MGTHLGSGGGETALKRSMGYDHLGGSIAPTVSRLGFGRLDGD